MLTVLGILVVSITSGTACYWLALWRNRTLNLSEQPEELPLENEPKVVYTIEAEPGVVTRITDPPMKDYLMPEAETPVKSITRSRD